MRIAATDSRTSCEHRVQTVRGRSLHRRRDVRVHGEGQHRRRVAESLGDDLRRSRPGRGTRSGAGRRRGSAPRRASSPCAKPCAMHPWPESAGGRKHRPIQRQRRAPNAPPQNAGAALDAMRAMARLAMPARLARSRCASPQSRSTRGSGSLATSSVADRPVTVTIRGRASHSIASFKPGRGNVCTFRNHPVEPKPTGSQK